MLPPPPAFKFKAAAIPLPVAVPPVIETVPPFLFVPVGFADFKVTAPVFPSVVVPEAMVMAPDAPDVDPPAPEVTVRVPPVAADVPCPDFIAVVPPGDPPAATVTVIPLVVPVNVVPAVPSNAAVPLVTSPTVVIPLPPLTVPYSSAVPPAFTRSTWSAEPMVLRPVPP